LLQSLGFGVIVYFHSPHDVDGCEFAAGDLDAGGVHRRIAFATDKTLGYLVFCRSLLFVVRTMSVIKYSRSPARRQAFEATLRTAERLCRWTDGRSVTARRFRDLDEDIRADLGGQAHLSEGQRQLVRRAAMLFSAHAVNRRWTGAGS
jgi:hypothetical protein